MDGVAGARRLAAARRLELGENQREGPGFARVQALALASGARALQWWILQNRGTYLLHDLAYVDRQR